MYSLNIDDFEKLIDAVKINKLDSVWQNNSRIELLSELNEIRDKALAIAWFQGECPLIGISDNIAQQIYDLKVELCN
ncbi:hypothetical protein FDI95_gp016 [Citrobacter phage CF1 ERZ-2017]|uniref:Uncharacterized protein n=1 Tax=Citrobacter phage CF1 ERZ-2017 TaxID=2267236 RepID=A0A2H4YFD8_9CAUD|nr:hypothetical protein FDI95_gp016 [Citrobacter phage CF1 ERZ-2017]AUE22889.1 hypothetical protein Cf1_00016 [Citrobacter phage CF1 ERZ-2017]